MKIFKKVSSDPTFKAVIYNGTIKKVIHDVKNIVVILA